MSEKTVSAARLIFVSLYNEQVGKQTIALRITLKRRSMTPSNIAMLSKFLPLYFLSQMKEDNSKPLNPNFYSNESVSIWPFSPHQLFRIFLSYSSFDKANVTLQNPIEDLPLSFH